MRIILNKSKIHILSMFFCFFMLSCMQMQTRNISEYYYSEYTKVVKNYLKEMFDLSFKCYRSKHFITNIEWDSIKKNADEKLYENIDIIISENIVKKTFPEKTSFRKFLELYVNDRKLFYELGYFFFQLNAEIIDSIVTNDSIISKEEMYDCINIDESVLKNMFDSAVKRIDGN